jgi:hypothetical protein
VSQDVITNHTAKTVPDNHDPVVPAVVKRLEKLDAGLADVDQHLHVRGVWIQIASSVSDRAEHDDSDGRQQRKAECRGQPPWYLWICRHAAGHGVESTQASQRRDDHEDPVRSRFITRSLRLRAPETLFSHAFTRGGKPTNCRVFRTSVA